MPASRFWRQAVALPQFPILGFDALVQRGKGRSRGGVFAFSGVLVMHLADVCRVSTFAAEPHPLLDAARKRIDFSRRLQTTLRGFQFNGKPLLLKHVGQQFGMAGLLVSQTTFCI